MLPSRPEYLKVRLLSNWLWTQRGEVLQWKGSNPRQLDRLLEDGQRWIDFRSKLQNQVEAAKRFAAEYCNRHDNLGALEAFLQRLVIFSDNVGQKISQLDDASKSLIQMVGKQLFSRGSTLTYCRSLT